MQHRAYDPDRDRDDALRVFREVGWCAGDEGAEAHALWAASGRTLVAGVDGRAECVVSNDGRMGYLAEDLGLSVVGAVATGRVARQRGLATRLTTFTRLWFGVRPATGLAYTARDLDAPDDLLERLDHVLSVPAPHVDWDF